MRTQIQQMTDRFSGDGLRQLHELLATFPVVNGDMSLAAALATGGEMHGVEKGNVFIQQGNFDQDVYFLLIGNVEVLVNGRQVAVRSSGSLLGEMAYLDAKRPRSATLNCIEDTLLLKLSALSFDKICAQFPFLWKRMAMQLADRLHERGTLVDERRTIPRLFVGSATENLALANALQAALIHDEVTVNVWTNNVFQPSSHALFDLLAESARCDYACFFVSPNDMVISRESEQMAPRDNVIFELGLFCGKLGHDRVYIITSISDKLKLPSDLIGIEPIRYRQKTGETVDISIQPVATKIRGLLSIKGTK